LSRFDNRPCAIQDGWSFFHYKAEEYSGSIKAWDDIVATILKDLPLRPTMGRPIPGYSNYYAFPILTDPPLLLLYQVVERNSECVIVLLDLRYVGSHSVGHP
jgi:hypothetical protein